MRLRQLLTYLENHGEVTIEWFLLISRWRVILLGSSYKGLLLLANVLKYSSWLSPRLDTFSTMSGNPWGQYALRCAISRL